MARVIFLLGLLPALSSANGLDVEAMARIRARLDAHSMVRAEFVQTKHMLDVERPIIARGRMLVAGRAGVIWEIERPLKTTIVLREDTTIQIAPDGRRTVRRSQDDAVAARVGRILTALLTGDAKALEQWFEVGVRMASEERWTISLSPRPGPMAAFLKSMQVSGNEFVEAVGIEETSGDATQIRFHNHRGVGALSDEERLLLAGQ
jgi:hypothetical protein